MRVIFNVIMLKKTIIVTISFFILSVLVGVCIWQWEKIKNFNIAKQKTQQEQSEEGWQNKEQINNDKFVWYEVPELGIKFKVTPDTKEDLKYNSKNNRMAIFNIDLHDTIFYSSSETDSSLKGCVLSEETGLSCGNFYINKIFKDQAKAYEEKVGKPYCEDSGGKTILENNDYYICLYSRNEISVFDNDKYKEEFHIMDNNDKNYGIFLDTIRILKNDNL